ncbi:MAG: DUF2203 domain-containing protein [Ignavibacteriaceae bacterium]|nr:DUF2203 domain-containing protein [Ignavibacteriaceae bacterium]NUM71838.1 DUF2203 domain-containing protein [Ignavibacteriaceae bacterium]
MEEIKRYFTPQEANRTLPLVKKIVYDILDEGKHVKEFDFTTPEQLQENPEMRERLDRIKSYIEELAEIGCFYKDWNFTIGLVDFPSVIDGRDVLLCWRSDEEYVSYYHDYESGYIGRKRIPEALL